VRPPSVTELERNEAEERITLATLRRAAEALDCTLVYAIVPNKPLEAMVQDAAAAADAPECGARRTGLFILRRSLGQAVGSDSFAPRFLNAHNALRHAPDL
jgi:hypothetical protein